jgi:hypothetical protein
LRELQRFLKTCIDFHRLIDALAAPLASGSIHELPCAACCTVARLCTSAAASPAALTGGSGLPQPGNNARASPTPNTGAKTIARRGVDTAAYGHVTRRQRSNELTAMRIFDDIVALHNEDITLFVGTQAACGFFHSHRLRLNHHNRMNRRAVVPAECARNDGDRRDTGGDDERLFLPV